MEEEAGVGSEALDIVRGLPRGSVRLGLFQVGGGTRGGWGLEALRGRLTELSGPMRGAAILTVAFDLVWEAQHRGEPLVWLTSGEQVFYPPDVARTGVDLEALIVVRGREPADLYRAASHLGRSGVFGLMVLDIGHALSVTGAVLSHLSGLAQRHHLVVIFLTRKEREVPSVGSLISVRAEARRAQRSDGGWQVELEVLKDKRWGPGFRMREDCDGPDGMC